VESLVLPFLSTVIASRQVPTQIAATAVCMTRGDGHTCMAD
jgi:hypothetical protein